MPKLGAGGESKPPRETGNLCRTLSKDRLNKSPAGTVRAAGSFGGISSQVRGWSELARGESGLHSWHPKCGGRKACDISLMPGSARVSRAQATGPRLEPPLKGFKPGVGEQSCLQASPPHCGGNSRASLGARGSFPAIPRARSIPTGGLTPLPPSWASGLVLVGDKEPFEVFGDVSQGLDMPLCQGARAGASCPPQLMALSFIFCLCSVWSSSAGSEARCLAFWLAEGCHPLLLRIVATDGSSPGPLFAPTCSVGLGGQLGSAVRVLRGSSPCMCLAGQRLSASLGWRKASGSPLVTFSPSQISELGSHCG